MRISSKGQVTIPLKIRQQAGLMPDMEVDFAIRNSLITISIAKKQKTRSEQAVDRLRNARPRTIMSTDEILALTRGDNE